MNTTNTTSRDDTTATRALDYEEEWEGAFSGFREKSNPPPGFKPVAELAKRIGLSRNGALAWYRMRPKEFEERSYRTGKTNKLVVHFRPILNGQRRSQRKAAVGASARGWRGRG